jgi:hypothetical protein
MYCGPSNNASTILVLGFDPINRQKKSQSMYKRFSASEPSTESEPPPAGPARPQSSIYQSWIWLYLTDHFVYTRSLDLWFDNTQTTNHLRHPLQDVNLIQLTCNEYRRRRLLDYIPFSFFFLGLVKKRMFLFLTWKHIEVSEGSAVHLSRFLLFKVVLMKSRINC